MIMSLTYLGLTRSQVDEENFKRDCTVVGDLVYCQPVTDNVQEANFKF